MLFQVKCTNLIAAAAILEATEDPHSGAIDDHGVLIDLVRHIPGFVIGPGHN